MWPSVGHALLWYSRCCAKHSTRSATRSALAWRGKDKKTINTFLSGPFSLSFFAYLDPPFLCFSLSKDLLFCIFLHFLFIFFCNVMGWLCIIAIGAAFCKTQCQMTKKLVQDNEKRVFASVCVVVITAPSLYGKNVKSFGIISLMQTRLIQQIRLTFNCKREWTRK